MDKMSIRDLDALRTAMGGVEQPCSVFAERHKSGSVWYVDCVLPAGHSGSDHQKANGETFRGR